MSHWLKPRVLLTDLGIGESPRWHEGKLWFCNWGKQEVISVDFNGVSQVMVNLPFQTFPFSIDWLPDGRLIIVSTSNRPLIVQEKDESLVQYADINLLGYKVWNEIVVDVRGNVYINGGNFNPMSNDTYEPGIIALITPQGDIRQVASNLAFPNGMAITQDGKTLIVAESYAKQLTAFDIDEGGDLSNRRVWADLNGDSPDGICLDAEGTIWYASVPNKQCVRIREGGEIVQTIQLDDGCFACALGNKINQELFIMTASWNGMNNISKSLPSGKVLCISAPAKGLIV